MTDQPPPYPPMNDHGQNPYQQNPHQQPGWQGYDEGPSQDERNWALAAHIGSFVAAYAALGFLAPLIVMLTKGPQSPYIRLHAVDSLNFQITALIYFIVSAILILVLIGIPMLIVGGIYYVVAVILGTVAASSGRSHRYPLAIRFVS